MPVARSFSAAMVNDDLVAVAGAPAGVLNRAGIGGINSRAYFVGNVNAAVAPTVIFGTALAAGGVTSSLKAAMPE